MSKYTHEELVAQSEQIASLVEEAKKNIQAAKSVADEFGLEFVFSFDEDMYPLSYFGGSHVPGQFETMVDKDGIPLDIDYKEYQNKYGHLDYQKVYQAFPGSRIVTRGWSPSSLSC